MEGLRSTCCRLRKVSPPVAAGREPRAGRRVPPTRFTSVADVVGGRARPQIRRPVNETIRGLVRIQRTRPRIARRPPTTIPPARKPALTGPAAESSAGDSLPPRRSVRCHPAFARSMGSWGHIFELLSQQPSDAPHRRKVPQILTSATSVCCGTPQQSNGWRGRHGTEADSQRSSRPANVVNSHATLATRRCRDPR